MDRGRWVNGVWSMFGGQSRQTERRHLIFETEIRWKTLRNSGSGGSPDLRVGEDAPSQVRSARGAVRSGWHPRPVRASSVPEVSAFIMSGVPPAQDAAKKDKKKKKKTSPKEIIKKLSMKKKKKDEPPPEVKVEDVNASQETLCSLEDSPKKEAAPEIVDPLSSLTLTDEVETQTDVVKTEEQQVQSPDDEFASLRDDFGSLRDEFDVKDGDSTSMDTATSTEPEVSPPSESTGYVTRLSESLLFYESHHFSCNL
ncbi:hypothetical protein GE061_010659 [Apolygus lucorum]|uniref:Uncharacterized protein n=1 Tax=Apolygus lucorum TaxID=248454 RepID=A0A6A4K8T0_APOLU|nr:hypothetical protein GE061_010659 [Apolygus lucorum]